MGNSVGGTAQSSTGMAGTHDENRKLIIASQDQYFKRWLENKDEDEDDEVDNDGGRPMSRLGRSRRSASQPPPADIDITKYDYPFENLVFEGGGTKGIAYCGAVKVLEELGILPNIKKFGGASIGAITAALFAVGFTADEIKTKLTEDDLSKIYIALNHAQKAVTPPNECTNCGEKAIWSKPGITAIDSLPT